MRYFIAFIISLTVSVNAHAQTITDSVLIEGNYRTFHFKQPKTKTKPAIVFVLHGSGGNGKDMMRGTEKLQALAVKENMIPVYPDGYHKFWNECRTASPARANKENINEEAFFTAMINFFSQQFKADTQNVFVVGTSGGGHMAYKLGLTMPDKIKAITAIIANLPDTTNMDCVPVNKPLPVMIINGTEDKINPYNGGEVKIEFSLGMVRSTERTFQYWANLAGYTGNPVMKKLPDTDPSDKRTIERYTYTEKGKPEIVLLKVIGGKHDYPNDIDVHVEAWRFFKRQITN